MNNLSGNIMPEMCNNGLDDDANGLYDCFDSDCPPCTYSCRYTVVENGVMDVTLVAGNAGTDSDYSESFALTDSIGVVVQITNVTPPLFTDLAAGYYRAFALSYNTTDGINNLSIGNLIDNVTGPCYNLSTPFVFRICENNTPVLDNLESENLIYCSGELSLTNTITALDADNDNLMATIQITNGYQSGEDFLNYNGIAILTNSFDAVSGTLTLGPASASVIQAGLRNTIYQKNAILPTVGTRELTFAITDGINTETTLTRTILVDTIPAANIFIVETSGNSDDDGVICLGGSIDLTATAGDTYLWSTGESTFSISKSPIINTTYEVTITNAAGCTNTTSILVTVESGPDLSGFEVSADNLCLNDDGNITIIGTLNDGVYDIVYDLSAPNAATNLTANFIVNNGMGGGMFSIPSINLSNSGSTIITIKSIAYANGQTCLSNTNINNTASFNVYALPVPITPFVTSNPTTCNGNDGSITIATLINGVTYEVTYTENNMLQSTSLVASAGTISITNLKAGVYENFVLANYTTSCVSATIAGPVTLVDPLSNNPTLAANSISNPTTCGGGDGRFVLEGLTVGNSYSVSYFHDGLPQSFGPVAASGTVPNGILTIPNLSAGLIENIAISNTTTSCSSNTSIAPFSLINPSGETAAIGLIANPTFCDGNDGSFIINGLTTGHSYDIDFINGGNSQSLVGLIATANAITISNLPAGDYMSFVINNTTTNCSVSSISSTISLVDPTQSPAIVDLGNLQSPTTCMGDDGSITLKDLVPAISYTIDLIHNGMPMNFGPAMTNGAGEMIITGLAAGQYDFIIVTNENTSCSSTASNGGPFVLSDPNTESPIILPANADNPTTCGAIDGQIEISNLQSGNTYSVEYLRNGSVITITNLTANASGLILIENLTAGTYTNFSVSNLTTNCIAALVNVTIDLVDPALTQPQLSSMTNPITCGGNEGVIIFNNLNPGEVYAINYIHQGISQSAIGLAANGTGAITLAGLTEGLYGNIFITNSSGCASLNDPAMMTLNDPSGLNPFVNISTDLVQPITCEGTEGQIKINGLIAGNNYTVRFYKNSMLQPIVTLIANAMGIVTISNLSSGSYDYFSLTENNSSCVAPTINGPFVLANPIPETASVTTVSNANGCGTPDGFIEISGLNSGDIYTISYTKNTLIQNYGPIEAIDGKILITTLTPDLYNSFNLTNTSTNCELNPITGTFEINDGATDIPLLNTLSGLIDPITCNMSDGSIEVSNLIPGTVYQVSYVLAGTLKMVDGLVANANGNIQLTSLSAGNYEMLVITNVASNCTADPLVGPFILNQPDADPAMILQPEGLSNPTICDGSDGKIEISALGSGESYDVTFIHNGILNEITGLIAGASGNIFLQELSIGNYENIVVANTTTGCISNMIAGPIELSNPINFTPTILLSGLIHPNYCGDTSGRITIGGLQPGEPYDFSYSKDGNFLSVNNGIANSTGHIVLDNLNEGSYGHFFLYENNSTCIASIEGGPYVLVAPVATCNDADNDGTIDILDPDDDNDGIPDWQEADCLNAISFGTPTCPEISNDDDGDGVLNYQDPDFCLLNSNGVCTHLDTDSDGIPDFLDNDSDNDGIVDYVEGNNPPPTGFDTDGDGIDDAYDPDQNGTGLNGFPPDTDGDGTPDYQDADSDNDGIPDADECPIGFACSDHDNDGTPDFQDPDSDDDGIPDTIESGCPMPYMSTVTCLPIDTDNDLIPDYLDPDSDNDGISDIEEGGCPIPYNSIANCNPQDYDGDGIPNHQDLDSDDDGIMDMVECITGTNCANTDNSAGPNYLDSDSDNDGISDTAEGQENSMNPIPFIGDSDNDGLDDAYDPDFGPVMPITDTDHDGVPDIHDLDSDSDNLLDAIEGNIDSDNDGVADFRDNDSDNDGIPDFVECPNVLSCPDSDGDDIPDYLDPDSDNDGIPDVDECPIGTACVDHDNDGIPDFQDPDSDNDGLPDSIECATGIPCPDTDNDGLPDIFDLDSDNDGIPDEEECPFYNGDITTCDGDDDGVPDYLDCRDANIIITSDAPNCQGEDLHLYAISAVANADYIWRKAGSNEIVSTAQNPIISHVNTTTNYELTLESNYCLEGTTKNHEAVVADEIQFTINNDGTDCMAANSNVILQLDFVLIPNVNFSNYSFSWTGPNGFISTMQNPILPNVTDETAGTYIATVISPDGCGTTKSMVVDISVKPLDPMISVSTPAPCEQGELILSIPEYEGTEVSYQWFGPNGSTGNGDYGNASSMKITNPTSIDEGAYSVYVIVDGCSSVFSETVTVILPTEEELQSPLASAQSNICEGTEVHLFASEVTDATYRWYEGDPAAAPAGILISTDQNPVLFNVPVGTHHYFVQAIKNECASPTTSTMITVEAAPLPPVISNNSPLCAGEQLILNAPSVTSATYHWSGPNNYQSNQENPIITNTDVSMSGTYQLYIETENCTSTIANMQVIIEAQPVTPIIAGSNAVCLGETIELFGPTVSNAIQVAYEWKGPNGFASPNQNIIIENTAGNNSGEYKLRTMINGCTSLWSAPKIVEVGNIVSPPVIINPTSLTNPACTGTNVLIKAEPVTGANYFWNGPNGFESNLSEFLLINTTEAMAGMYELHLEIGNCTSETIATPVFINTQPLTPIISSPIQTVCLGGTIELFGPTINNGNDISYEWTGPNGFTSAVQNPIIENATQGDNGNYQLVLIVDGCQSLSSTPLMIEVSEVPVNLNISNSTSTIAPGCHGSEIVLITDTIPGANYYWHGPNNFESNLHNPVLLNAHENMSGIYTLFVELGGCTSQTSTTEVYINTSVEVPITNDISSICLGAQVQLFASIVTTGNDIIFEWIGPNGFTSTEQNPVIASVTINEIGNYQVAVTIDGCTSGLSMPILIEVNDLPITPEVSNSSSVGQPACAGTDIQLMTDFIPGASYLWTGPNGFLSSLPNPLLTDVSSTNIGLYRVFITMNNCASEAGYTNVYIQESIPIPVAINNGPVCNAGQLILSVTNPDIATTYEWFSMPSNTSIGTGVTLIMNDVDESFSGSYYVLATLNDCTSNPEVQNNFGEDAFTEVVIEQASEVMAYAGDDLVTCQDSITISAYPTNSGQWSMVNGNANTLILNRDNQRTLVMNLESGTNTFIWSIDAPVCGTSSSDTLVVEWVELPEANDDQYDVEYNQTLRGFDLTLNDNLPSSDYQITILNEVENGTLVEMEDGTYTYWPETGFVGTEVFEYSICDKECAEKCSEAVVEINIGGGAVCEAPTTITPNDDGLNDSFIVPCLPNYSGSSINVFNRWGDEIYVDRNYQNDWYGTFNGEPLPVGTYYYILKINNEKQTILSGYIFLQR